MATKKSPKVLMLEQKIDMLIMQAWAEPDKTKRESKQKIISRYAQLYKNITGEFYRRPFK